MARKISIVGGCGHIGLPLGIVLSEAGYQVSLYDIDQAKVDMVNRGELPFEERGADEALVKAIKAKTLKATTDIREGLSSADTVVLTVGTPVDEYLNPRIQDVLEVVDSLVPYLTHTETIILRSTLFPGTSAQVMNRLRKKGVEASVTFCPERIAQGYALEEMRNLPQIISSFDSRGLEVVQEIFGRITNGKVVAVKPIEAELAKLFCNTWRYINFAISNQFYQIAHQAGGDFNQIHRASTLDYPRMKAFAGAGFAAGPCLFKDTMQLAAFSQNRFFLGHSAMLINEGMPAFVIDLIKERVGPNLADKKIGILGLTFKRDNDDIRESLSFKLKKLLECQGAEVRCYDPHLTSSEDPRFSLSSLDEVLACESIVIGTPHTAFEKIDYANKQNVIDIWNFLRI